ncbi:GntR family transcriptional regulator [Planotetraspora sp. A-T 1434]|uniref:GntR family transcriptional regulator n=1 Tax=Planotetraspora sp. A-T 1434 TaxID=2979219 RepID=UPI0021BE9A3E|nr:GntR family transcriptional regulator [Planotetraspora sp. A-T 1434]MCT9932397.1 GntR family transcriptional regulator [Planotetraspora sp. A-T 1434]
MTVYEPAYRRLIRLIRQDIKAGEYPPGSLLPSENRLIQIHGVGRETVRSALAVLRSTGEVVTIRGVGSQVRETFDRDDEPVTKGARIIARMPTDEEMRQLDMTPGVPLLVVERDGREVAVLPADRKALIVK